MDLKLLETGILGRHARPRSLRPKCKYKVCHVLQNPYRTTPSQIFTTNWSFNIIQIYLKTYTIQFQVYINIFYDNYIYINQALMFMNKLLCLSLIYLIIESRLKLEFDFFLFL